MLGACKFFLCNRCAMPELYRTDLKITKKENKKKFYLYNEGMLFLLQDIILGNIIRDIY
jgi:hypothetical protein